MRTFIMGRWYDEEGDRFDGQPEVTDLQPHMAQFLQKPGECVNHRWLFTGGGEDGTRYYRCRVCDKTHRLGPDAGTYELPTI